MIKYITAFSLLGNLVLLGTLFFENSLFQKGKHIVGTSKQIKCLETWKGKKYYIQPIYGPEMFQQLYLVDIGAIPENTSFESEFSGCFNDAYMKHDGDINSLPNSYNILVNQGISNIGIYKSPENESVILFGKSD
jgi:hypothetical protein